MTNEEAIKVLDDMKIKIAIPKSAITQRKRNEALDMAIKALEQEPILDKIKAEIKSKIVKRPWLDFEDRERDRNDAFLEVLDIINKYKLESEDEK